MVLGDSPQETKSMSAFVESEKLRELDIQDRAFRSLEERNSAFRVLYDTVLAVEGATADEIISILCINLRKISNASWAALATYDSASRTMTLGAFDSAPDEAISFGAECLGSTVRITPDVIDDFVKSQLQDCISHNCCLIEFFPSIIHNAKPTSEARCYRISCVRNGELIAAGGLQLRPEQDLKMQDLISTYLNMAGMILQRVMTVKALHRQEEMSRAQRDLGMKLSKTSNLKETLKLCVEAAIDISGMDCGAVYLINEIFGTMELAFHIGLSDDFARNISVYDADSPNTALVMEGKPIYTQYYSDDIKGKLFQYSEDLRAAAIIPIHYEGNTIACLNIGSHSVEDIPLHSRNALEAISAQIGSFIARARSEEALRLSQEKYRNLTDNLDIGVYRSTPEISGKIVEANPALIRMLGYGSMEEFLTLSITDLYQNPVDEKKFIQKLLISGSMKKEELYLKKKDGTIIIGLVSSMAMKDENGEAIYLDGIIEDITDHKRVEEELMKIEKLESVGVLAGGIAHDLNNFLSAIMGNISLVEMYLADKAAEDICEKLLSADKACYQVERLTQQLLTFSKGGAPIKELAAIDDIIIDSTTFALRGSKSRCEFSIPDDLWAAEIDTGQISQVINNLAINADQAMSDGGTIWIRTENTNVDAASNLPLANGQYIKVSVEDQGKGIPEEVLNKIFDPFFTTKQDGNGLGLASAYSIIQRHNGHITVESQSGQGTAFHIYLPASPGLRIKKEKTAIDKPIMGTGKILVMDDDQRIRDAVSGMLVALGYEALTAIDGSDAISLYRKAMKSGEPFDAVILDLTIPGGMNGMEAIHKLIEIDPGVKAIVSSGYSNDAVMANFEEHGFSGVIAKPYRLKDLSNILYKIIAKKSSL